MWPFFLRILNLPKELQNDPKYVIFTGVNVGKGSPKNINCMLQPIVEQLQLFYKGTTKNFTAIKIVNNIS